MNVFNILKILEFLWWITVFLIRSITLHHTLIFPLPLATVLRLGRRKVIILCLSLFLTLVWKLTFQNNILYQDTLTLDSLKNRKEYKEECSHQPYSFILLVHLCILVSRAGVWPWEWGVQALRPGVHGASVTCPTYRKSPCGLVASHSHPALNRPLAYYKIFPE